MIDTKFYSEEFKSKLFNKIENIDEQCDGLLIHAENFQALNLLQERYREQIKCIYIDPPYNTGNDGFVYRDNYQHSSWISMMENRLREARKHLLDDGVIFGSIDYHENYKFRMILDSIFNDNGFIGEIYWESKTKSQNTKTSYSKLQPKAEMILLYSNNEKQRFNLLEKEKKTYPFKDKQGLYREYPLEVMNAIGVRGRETMIYTVSDGVSTVSPPSGKQWKLGQAQVSMFQKTENLFIRDNKVIIKMRPDFERNERTEPFWGFLGKEIGTAESAKSELSDMVVNHGIETVKPVNVISRLIFHASNSSSTILDFFAGSGTTGHAVINLNREDGGKRKYILVEMADYFDTVLKPRIEKVVYSPDWKDGRPTSFDKGVSHCFKYMTLESYEDTLNNLSLAQTNVPQALKREYLLNYMLDIESRGSLLSTDDFKNPFDYRLNIATDSSGATAPQKIDLVETFNYLIGLRVEGTDRHINQGIVIVTGYLATGEHALIIWRDCTKIDNIKLQEWLKQRSINPLNSEFDVFYVNGDHNLENYTKGIDGAEKTLKVRQIEDEFLTRMFGEE